VFISANLKPVCLHIKNLDRRNVFKKKSIMLIGMNAFANHLFAKETQKKIHYDNSKASKTSEATTYFSIQCKAYNVDV
jgi:hypothetical protein